MFSVLPSTPKCHYLCHVMFVHPSSHCGSDGAILSLPQHSPMCCYLSHQGHPTALTFAHTTWTATPPFISALSRVLFVCDQLIHLTLITVFFVLQTEASSSPLFLPTLPLPSTFHCSLPPTVPSFLSTHCPSPPLPLPSAPLSSPPHLSPPLQIQCVQTTSSK